MSMTVPHGEPENWPCHTEPGFPCLLNVCVDDGDDLGDW